MTTKIKVKPVGLGAISGLALVFVGAKMMKKKATAKHYIIGGLLGAVAGFVISNMAGEKKSNMVGAASNTRTYKGVTGCKGCPAGTTDTGSGCKDANGFNLPYSYGTAFCH